MTVDNSDSGVWMDTWNANRTLSNNGASDGLFQNDGIYRKTGSGVTTVSVDFASPGALDVLDGEVVFTGGRTTSLSGNVNVAEGSTVATRRSCGCHRR